MLAPTISQPLNFGQRLLYGLVCALIWPLSALPLRIHYLFSDLVLFPLVFHVAGYRRRIVQKNLRDSFPEKGEAELGDTVTIMACRPISKTKKFRLVSVDKKAIANQSVAEAEEALEVAEGTKTEKEGE